MINVDKKQTLSITKFLVFYKKGGKGILINSDSILNTKKYTVIF